MNSIRAGWQSYVILLLLCWSWVPGSFAVVDIREFKSEADEQRYQTLMDELRCPKCQNQNLSGSDSQIASDLRRELYRMIDEGQSSSEIKTFMVDRYGDYILYRPRLTQDTYALWFGPGLLLLLGLVVLVWIVRKRSMKANVSAQEMTKDEKARLEAMIKETE